MQTYPPLYSLKSEVRVVPCPPPLAGNHIPGAYLVDRSSSDNVATLCSDWARQVSTRRSCSAMLTTSPITPRSAADSENCCAASQYWPADVSQPHQACLFVVVENKEGTSTRGRKCDPPLPPNPSEVSNEFEPSFWARGVRAARRRRRAQAQAVMMT